MPPILLIDRLKEIFFEELDKLYGSSYIEEAENYIKENRKEIVRMCEDDKEFNKELEKELGKFIIHRVKESYYPKLCREQSVLSLAHPEYFAYALQEKSFSSAELRKINLEKQLWQNEIIREFSEENIIKKYKKELLDSD